jgi:hypothetical protein
VSEWAYLRAGFVVVGMLIAAALASWAVQTARYEDPGYERTRQCLLDEKALVLTEPSDPIAASAELGAIRTLIETNGVTVAVAGSREEAERLAASYRSVGGELGSRLEIRGRQVYLWDREPSPTQRQTLYDCAY